LFVWRVFYLSSFLDAIALDDLALVPFLFLVLASRSDKVIEQGMGTGRARFKLGMKLTAQHPRMIVQLDDLDQSTIGR
jgi:hypothetical protein